MSTIPPDDWDPRKAIWLRGASHYLLDYKRRDGREEDSGDFIYGGPAEGGTHEFRPVGGGPAIYLFPDEIMNVEGDF